MCSYKLTLSFLTLYLDIPLNSCHLTHGSKNVIKYYKNDIPIQTWVNYGQCLLLFSTLKSKYICKVSSLTLKNNLQIIDEFTHIYLISDNRGYFFEFVLKTIYQHIYCSLGFYFLTKNSTMAFFAICMLYLAVLLYT